MADAVDEEKEGAINFLCKHSFKECSDLPRLPPLFSCAACDEWRQRLHRVRYNEFHKLKNRASISKRFQCQRASKGYGPIHIRVIANSSANSESPAPLAIASPLLDQSGCKRKNLRAAAIRKELDDKEALRRCLEENSVLNNSLEECRKKLKSTQAMLSRSRQCQQKLILQKPSKQSSPNEEEVDPFKKLCESIDKVFSVHYPGKDPQTKAKILLEALSGGILFHGEGVALLQELKRLYVRDIFKDWKVLKAFDCSSIGAFKTSTVKALHSVLDDQKIGLFPSPSSIDRARGLLDKYTMSEIGCRRELTKYGEVYFMNFDKVIRLLLKATGLYEKAQRTRVSLSFTADGALLLSSRTHVSCGVKITDIDGLHPVTKKPLAIPSSEENENEMVLNCMQSRELCAIMVMADAKDSKDLYEDVFKDFYEYSERLRMFGMPVQDGEPALHPFLVSHPQDMKSTQTVCKRGGNCKMKLFFLSPL